MADRAKPMMDMGAWGWTLVVIGVLACGFALSMDVSVATESAELFIPSRVVNMDLVATRQMVMTGGLAAFVSGVVLLAASKVVEAISRQV